MFKIKYSDILILISVLITYYFINAEDDLDTFNNFDHIKHNNIKSTLYTTIDLDYIRPNKINCDKNSNNGLYCWGGHKHERDFNIILKCYQDIYSINNEQGNKRLWDFYDKLNNHKTILYDDVGSIVDSSTIYKDSQGNNIVHFSPCIYILKALKNFDNNKPFSTQHHINRYDNL